jgi:hypothetical protein
MSGVSKIDEIEFRNEFVDIYFDEYGDSNDVSIIWRMRNPDSCYQGIVYMNNETGKITYPEDAVIPEQTDEDREIIPKAIIVSAEVDGNIREKILSRLESEYLRRNNC